MVKIINEIDEIESQLKKSKFLCSQYKDELKKHDELKKQKALETVLEKLHVLKTLYSAKIKATMELSKFQQTRSYISHEKLPNHILTIFDQQALRSREIDVLERQCGLV